MENISVVDSIIIAVVGFSVVILALGMLALFIRIMASSISKMNAEKSAPAPAPAPAPEAPKAPAKDPNKVELPATTSMGSIDLHNVSDRDAALIMAIVADKLDAPLNTLVFKSIKEVK